MKGNTSFVKKLITLLLLALATDILIIIIIAKLFESSIL